MPTHLDTIAPDTSPDPARSARALHALLDALIAEKRSGGESGAMSEE
ncbi:hypothetical protein [Streptomyces sp. NBC_00354]|nr:hypothetical protein OG296_40995 [Streptomyces sp. NBC_01001]